MALRLIEVIRHLQLYHILHTNRSCIKITCHKHANGLSKKLNILLQQIIAAGCKTFKKNETLALLNALTLSAGNHENIRS